MAGTKSRSRLQSELEEANEYIEELESRLDSIAGIVSGDEEDEGTEDED